MKKYLLSTLTAAAAMVVPAWAAVESFSDLGFEYNNSQFYATPFLEDSDDDYGLKTYAVSWSSGSFGSGNTLEFILDSGESAGGFGLTGGASGVTTIYCDHNGNEDYFTVSGTITFAYGASVVVDASNFVFQSGEESATIKLIISSSIVFYDEGGASYSLSSGNTEYLDSFVENYITVIGNYELSDWGYDEDGALCATIIRAIPEPALFSVFFGLGALGLVATRRRRRA